MEEEESIFQPLLNQYFNYEELVQIKVDNVVFNYLSHDPFYFDHSSDLVSSSSGQSAVSASGVEGEGGG